MTQTINYLDIDRKEYSTEYRKEEVDTFLENKQIINIETLEGIIRFWYKQD
jgi:hypothetical protein